MKIRELHLKNEKKDPVRAIHRWTSGDKYPEIEKIVIEDENGFVFEITWPYVGDPRPVVDTMGIPVFQFNSIHDSENETKWVNKTSASINEVIRLQKENPNATYALAEPGSFTRYILLEKKEEKCKGDRCTPDNPCQDTFSNAMRMFKERCDRDLILFKEKVKEEAKKDRPIGWMFDFKLSKFKEEPKKKEFTYKREFDCTFYGSSLANQSPRVEVKGISVCDKVFEIKEGMSAKDVTDLYIDIYNHIYQFIKNEIRFKDSRYCYYDNRITHYNVDSTRRWIVVSYGNVDTTYYLTDNMDPKDIQDILIKVCERVKKYIEEGK